MDEPRRQITQAEYIAAEAAYLARRIAAGEWAEAATSAATLSNELHTLRSRIEDHGVDFDTVSGRITTRNGRYYEWEYLAADELRRLAGERTIAVTYSDVCTGAGTPAPAAVSPLEVAARRSLIGLSIIDLATALDVNEKTVRRWESPTDATPISERNLARLDSLVAEHTAAVEAVTTITEITIGERPYGWYAAIAARVLDRSST